MKRQYLIPIIVFSLVSFACSLSLPSDISLGGKQPTAEAARPDKSTPTAELPESKEVYQIDFELLPENWSDDITMTTQALPGKMNSQIDLENGWLKFHIKDFETYLYKFYRDPMPRDVVIETKALNTGDVHNGTAIICRAAVDYTKWYEFRVSNSNDYALYYYDQKVKEEDGKNPYQELARGVSPAISPMKENTIIASCIDTTLRLDINGTQVFIKQTDILMDGGLVGLGAMSYDLLPVVVKYDYLEVGEARN